MNNAEIIVRADGNSKMGLGHVVRALSLARMVADLAPVSFATQFPDAFISSLKGEHIQELAFPAGDYEEVFFNYVQEKLQEKTVILVLDGYGFDSSFQKRFHDAGAKIVYIDDLIKPDYYCHVIINTAEGISPEKYSTATNARIYTGRNYALLRPAFLEAAQKKAQPANDPKHVFLSFGASDPESITLKILAVLKQQEQLETIHVLTSRLNRNLELLEFSQHHNDTRIRLHLELNESGLLELLQRCDLCITSASTIAMEIMAVGKPLICGITAPNQELLYAAFEQEKVCLTAGNFVNDYRSTVGLPFLFKLLEASKLREAITAKQKQFIDGRSGERIREIFRSFFA